MNHVYELIQSNPAYFAWCFGIINVLWVLFTYFNKQSHDKKLASLKHDLNLDMERRKKVFELKINQYESYVSSLDAFGKKHQVDLPARMQPIFDKYLSEYLAATDAEDKEKEREVIGWFGAQISTLMQEGLSDVLKLQSESNRLKLTATEDMITTFNELEALTQESMDIANEFMGKFTEIVITQNEELSGRYQRKLAELSQCTKDKAHELMQKMREDLSAI